MWKVRQFIRHHNAIDDRGALDFERVLDRAAQLAGLCGTKAVPAASARERQVVWIGNSMPSYNCAVLERRIHYAITHLPADRL
jgi:hypothetical protein